MEFVLALFSTFAAALLQRGVEGAAAVLQPALRGSAMPTVTLSNGLIVGNFSSPHAFHFTDGTVLPACSAERRVLSQLDVTEKGVSRRRTKIPSISVEMTLSEAGRIALHEASKVKCDVIIVPRPVLDALKAAGRDVVGTKFRTVRLADRPKKIAHTDKFCV